MLRFHHALCDELLKTAGPGLQAAIDAKLAPLKPPAPAMPSPPPASTLAANAMKPPGQTPTIEQTKTQMQAKIKASPPSQPYIKSPKTVFGVRG